MENITVDKTMLETMVTKKAEEIAATKIAEIERKRVPSYLQSAPAVFKNGLCKDGYDVDTPEGAALMFARALRALGASSLPNGGRAYDYQKAAQILTEWQGKSKFESDSVLIKGLMSGSINKSVNAGNLAEGGLFVSDDHYTNVIEYLSAALVVRNLKGVEIVNATRGNLKFTRETNLLTGGWVGEQGSRDPETPLSDAYTMLAKKLMCIVIISNDWLRRADLADDRTVLARIQKGMNVTEDSGLLRGIGTQYAPLGIRYQVASSNLIPQSGTTISAITTDLLGAMGAVAASNVQIQNPAWIMHPLKHIKLMSLRNATTDTYAFPDALQGMLYNAPIVTSTAIPINLGGGGNESEIYYGEASELTIGETTNVDVNISDNIAYNQGGSVVSGFSTDRSGIRVIKETDIYLRHTGAFSVVTGVTW